MVCPLLDRRSVLGAVALDVRFGVGAIAVFVPRSVHWDCYGCSATVHLQPGMGAGVASSKTARPVFNSIKSVVTHTVFGFGMYLAALATASILAFDK